MAMHPLVGLYDHRTTLCGTLVESLQYDEKESIHVSTSEVHHVQVKFTINSFNTLCIGSIRKH